MNKKNLGNYSDKVNFYNLYRNTAIVSLVWILLIASIVLWAMDNERTHTKEMAKNEAQSVFNKDLALRLWVSSHGGIYVTPNEITPPSPYLSHIPDRDVQTTSGKTLTLMN